VGRVLVWVWVGMNAWMSWQSECWREEAARRFKGSRRPPEKRQIPGPLTRHDAPHVVAHVRKIKVGVSDGKVHVKLRDLLPQQQQVHDGKELPVELARPPRDHAGRQLDAGGAGGDGLVGESGKGLGGEAAVELTEEEEGGADWRVPAGQGVGALVGLGLVWLGLVWFGWVGLGLGLVGLGWSSCSEDVQTASNKIATPAPAPPLLP
jgi:hypothetical protein